MTIPKANISATADTEAVRSFQVAGVHSTLGQFNYVSGTNVVLFVSASLAQRAALANAGAATVTYSEVPVAYDRGDFEDSTQTLLVTQQLHWIFLKST